MENRTQFNLDQQLDRWRQRLLARESFRMEDAEELESHLLDSMSQLREQGLSAEEAFAVA